jgi:hypothetical protein
MFSMNWESGLKTDLAGASGFTDMGGELVCGDEDGAVATHA